VRPIITAIVADAVLTSIIDILLPFATLHRRPGKSLPVPLRAAGGHRVGDDKRQLWA
jgi:hypothetical protein